MQLRLVILGLPILSAWGMTGCSWPVSESTKVEVATAVLLARLDTIYHLHSHFIDLPDAERGEHRRVLFIGGKGVDERVADRIRESLQFPFLAVRVDSTSLNLDPDTRYSDDGRPYEVPGPRDRVTDLMVTELYVDSIRGRWLRGATAYLLEGDAGAVHYMRMEWVLRRGIRGWSPSRSSIVWIN